MKFLVGTYSLNKKMIIYITILIAVIILVQSFILYVNFEKVGAKLIFNSNLNILSQISYSANYMNDSARIFASSIYSDSKNLPIMYSKKEEIELIDNQMKNIDIMVNQSPYIYSVYIYNGNLKKYYSTLWETILDSKDFIDRDIVNIIENKGLPKDYKFSPMLRKVPLNNYRGPNQLYVNVLTYFIFDRFYNSDEIQSAIIINVKVDYLTGVINALNSKGDSISNKILIMNQDGIITESSKSREDFDYNRDKGHLEKLINSKGKSGYFKDKINNKSVIVTYVPSDLKDWRFVGITSYKEIFKDIDKMGIITAVICIVIVLLGLLLSYFLAKYLYSPIRNMMGKVTKAANIKFDNKITDEIDFLSKVFIDNIETTKSLKSIKTENDIYKKQQALISILTEESLGLEQIERIFEKHSIELEPNKQICICIFQVDFWENFNRKYSIEDQKLIKFAVGNVVGEMLEGSFKNEYIPVDGQQIVMMLQSISGEAGDIYSGFSGIARKVQDWCESNLELSLTVAVSFLVPGIIEVGQAYKHVIELSKYRFIYGHKSILEPEIMDNVKANGFVHPLELEHQLDDCLSSGKVEECIKIYHKIIDYISSYSYDTIASYKLYFSYFIYSKANDMVAKGYEKLYLDCNEFTQLIISLETLEEVNTKFIELFRTITEMVNQKKFKRKSALAEKIANIIEENYTDVALCQEGVASDLNISKDYIGRIFKEAYSKSFAEYLTDVRLNKAAQLLCMQNKSISDIVDEIGWENKNYFYTMFKAKFGVTTSEHKTKFINLNKSCS